MTQMIHGPRKDRSTFHSFDLFIGTRVSRMKESNESPHWFIICIIYSFKRSSNISIFTISVFFFTSRSIFRFSYEHVSDWFHPEWLFLCLFSHTLTRCPCGPSFHLSRRNRLRGSPLSRTSHTPNRSFSLTELVLLVLPLIVFCFSLHFARPRNLSSGRKQHQNF